VPYYGWLTDFINGVNRLIKAEITNLFFNHEEPIVKREAAVCGLGFGVWGFDG